MTEQVIPGYQPVDDEKIMLVAANKQMEELILRALDDLLMTRGSDPRWISIARTHFEEGFMAMNRSIIKPPRIKLPRDNVVEAEAVKS